MPFGECRTFVDGKKPTLFAFSHTESPHDISRNPTPTGLICNHLPRCRLAHHAIAFIPDHSNPSTLPHRVTRPFLIAAPYLAFLSRSATCHRTHNFRLSPAPAPARLRHNTLTSILHSSCRGASFSSQPHRKSHRPLFRSRRGSGDRAPLTHSDSATIARCRNRERTSGDAGARVRCGCR